MYVAELTAAQENYDTCRLNASLIKASLHCMGECRRVCLMIFEHYVKLKTVAKRPYARFDDTHTHHTHTQYTDYTL